MLWPLVAEYSGDDDDDDDDDENSLKGADLIVGKISDEYLLPATNWIENDGDDDCDCDDDGDKDTRKARPEIVSCSKTRPVKRKIVIHHLLVTVMVLKFTDRCRVIQKI